MKLDILTERPPVYASVAAFGLEKRGKTTNVMRFLLRLHKLLDLKGHIAIVDTEGMVNDWWDRIVSVTALPPVVCPPDKDGDRRNPAHVAKFLQAASVEDRISAIFIDSMTDLQRGPRDKHQAEKGRGIKLNEYQGIDRPYNSLVELLKHIPKHCAYTFREADDRVEVDGEEKIVGKKPKGGQGGYVPRMIMHCTTARKKGETAHLVAVSDTKAAGTDHLVNPSPEAWDKYIERLRH